MDKIRRIFETAIVVALAVFIGLLSAHWYGWEMSIIMMLTQLFVALLAYICHRP